MAFFKPAVKSVVAAVYLIFLRFKKQVNFPILLEIR